MLVRDAYEEAYRFLNEHARDADSDPSNNKQRNVLDRAAIITGHPGIGKTWFLSLVLVQRLLNGQQTVLQYTSEDSENKCGVCNILFNRRGAKIIDSLRDVVTMDPDIWALCDCKPLYIAACIMSLYMVLWNLAEMVCTEYVTSLLVVKADLKSSDEGPPETGERRRNWYLEQGAFLQCWALEGGPDRAVNVKGQQKSFSTFFELLPMVRMKVGSPEFAPGMAGIYIRPDRMTLTALDSLLVILEQTTPQAIMFQITLLKDHPLKTDGLRAVWNALPATVQKNDPVVVFLVPEGICGGYKIQKIEPPIAPYVTWKQYVCGMADRHIWGLDTDGFGRSDRRVVSDSLHVSKLRN
ncbi:hypothetical protein FN846DRAFT_909607 [Sphaerosporella brunnea]|uniref:Uncharacterized protein n=1 Tax=Sphaerosporella brunnea TaxID=1250544 RepID=A0A5J5ERE4_9PEZI|nr:hypothetical protein FN846DRAFT_909607 [Sphaerosporella brunnea]